MKCKIHEMTDATAICAFCGNHFCQECLTLLNGAYYCKEHTKYAINSKTLSNQQNNFQTSTPPMYPNNVISRQNGPSAINKTTMLLLCFFLGFLGVHRFYSKHYLLGFIYFFTFGVFGIGVILDLIALLTNTYKDASGNVIK